MIDVNGTSAKVRLIGLDTPESVHEDESKNNEYGVMASDYTKELLSNIDTVYLTYDVELKDQYDRMLAYVWIDKPTGKDDEIKDKMLNYTILSDGYAINIVYAPNEKYASYFEEACKDAQTNERGLWQYDGYRNLVL